MICFIIHDITTRGGTERAQANLANALAARGESISIWSLYRRQGSPSFALSPKITVSYGRRIPLPYFFDYPWLMCAFAIHVIRHRARWIVCTDTNRLIVALLAAFVPGVRLAVWEHFALSHSISKARGRLSRWLSAILASRVVTLTERDKEDYVRLYDPAGKVMSIPNIVAPRVLSQKPRRKEILAVGRLTFQKGFDLLLDAWSIASAQLSDWSLRIVGDGELHDQLLQQARDLGIEHRVTLAPFSDNPFALYAESGMFVLSSRFEGLPFVLLEAMTCGTPCISFDCPNGPREVIRNGINGLLTPAENVNALSNSIVELGRDPELRQRLGNAARSVSEEFSEASVVARWQGVFCD